MIKIDKYNFKLTLKALMYYEENFHTDFYADYEKATSHLSPELIEGSTENLGEQAIKLVTNADVKNFTYKALLSMVVDNEGKPSEALRQELENDVFEIASIEAFMQIVTELTAGAGTGNSAVNQKKTQS